MRNSYNRPAKNKFYTLNQNIQAPQLRVIDSEGKQVGVLSREEALNKAQTEEIDLVLIAPQAAPPVAKIIDFKKFLYQEGKKLKEAKKGIKKSSTKDIKLSLFIATGDLDRMIERGREFLKSGNQLRLNLTLKGREMGKRDMGMNLIKKYIESLGEVNISKEPRQEGRVIRAVVSKRK